MIELGKSGQRVEDHCVGPDRMVENGSGTQRSRKPVTISRHLCELVIQNADPAPAPAAFSPSPIPQARSILVGSKLVMVMWFRSRCSERAMFSRRRMRVGAITNHGAPSRSSLKYSSNDARMVDRTL
jgi:hypothetical protein